VRRSLLSRGTTCSHYLPEFPRFINSLAMLLDQNENENDEVEDVEREGFVVTAHRPRRGQGQLPASSLPILYPSHRTTFAVATKGQRNSSTVA
jgi:hypothetical protein